MPAMKKKKKKNILTAVLIALIVLSVAAIVYVIMFHREETVVVKPPPVQKKKMAQPKAAAKEKPQVLTPVKRVLQGKKEKNMPFRLCRSSRGNPEERKDCYCQNHAAPVAVKAGGHYY